MYPLHRQKTRTAARRRSRKHLDWSVNGCPASSSSARHPGSCSPNPVPGSSPRHSAPSPARSAARGPGFGSPQWHWRVGLPRKSAGPWRTPVRAVVGDIPRTTTPGLPHASGTARSFRPGGAARLCGSGSPGARFTAPRAPRARRSRGAPAGRYATEAA